MKTYQLFFIGGFLLAVCVWGQTRQTTNLSLPEPSPTNTSQGGTSPIRLEGATSIVFESFDRVSLRNYEAVAVQEVIFTGNVRILFEGRKLSAQRAYVTIQSNKHVLHIAAFDQVEFRDGQAFYLAESFFYEPDKKTGRMRRVRSYLKDTTGTTTAPGFFYHADEVEIVSEKRAIFKKAHLTFTPADLPHYEIYAERVWYFRDDLIFALHTTYTVGQQRLFYFPFFLRLEKATGIKTSAGIEKRIGWYVMNTLDWSPAFGNMQTGLDFYERMGEYGFIRYANKKPIGPFQQVRFFGEAADDVRLFYDAKNDRYSQWILINDEWTTIRQFSWHYMLEGTVQRENFTLSFYTEDLNDPFFSKKYAQRRENFNIQHILQPQENSFFSQSDNSPSYSSLSRRFTITSPQLTLNGQWTYQRRRNEKVSNIYRNDAYTYYLYMVSFPNITYTLPSITLVDNVSFKTYRYVTNQARHDPFSLTRNETTNQKESPTAAFGSSGETNRTQPNSTNQPFSGVAEEVRTNIFEWWSVSSSVNGNLSYTSSETLDTNALLLSDSYHHQENGSLSFNVKLLNKQVNWDHSLSILNRKRWSSFEVNYTNNMLYSGAQVDYTMRSSTGTTPHLGRHSFWKVQFPLSLSHTFQYQLFRSIDQQTPRFYTHAVNASAGMTWLSNLLSYRVSYAYQTTYRITNGVEDEYLNNQVKETMSAHTSVTVWWFSSSTSVALDTLRRRYSEIKWYYPEITNRIQGSILLESAFRPSAAWSYIPTVTHRYDLLKQTNVSLAFFSSATVGNFYPDFLYKVESLVYQANLTIDYLSPRSSFFSLNFGSVVWLQKYWKLHFTTQVMNRKLYRYDYRACGVFNEPYVNFWQNLWDGLNLFDYEGLKRSFFKIQALNFSFTHYLNEWEMRVSFSIQRQLDTLRRIAYWEPQLRIEFSLSGTRDQFPPYTRRFLPPELQ